MSTFFQFLSQIYTLLSQVHEIVKANNQFAQSVEQRLLKIEESLNFEIPQVDELQKNDFESPLVPGEQIPEV